ncbi:MAG: Lrp/AsnC family transcriptional regulator [Lachnospiraceae bacterium]|nr:Lrp/AsnC family transcriptional regulator [Lachnospiraceae bacterium]MBQ6197384.1 Lrp/AsnC family transcriptional regulator [Lachnospiraceae bacterium]
MDKIDRMLIRLLQQNARYSLKQLSERVFLSSPAVAARIDKLEREGVITGYRANVDLDKTGYHITVFVNLEMNPKQKPAFIDYIQTVPNVLECNIVSGNYTMLIKAAFPSTVDLDKFIGQIQKYGTTETHIVFSTPVPPRGIIIYEEEESKE